MIFCSKFIKTITSSALLAGVASSSFVSAYDTKLRRGMSCNEDKDISSRDSKLKDLTKKDVTNGDDENLFEDDELVISKLKYNKSSSESDLLKSSNLKTVASIISASSSIGILSGLAKKLFFDKKANPTKPDDPEPHIQDDDKSNDDPDSHKKEEKKDEPGPSPVTPASENSNKKYIVNPTKPDEPEPHIQDDDKNKDNPGSHEKREKKDEPVFSPGVSDSGNNSNKKYVHYLTTLFVLSVLLYALYKFRKYYDTKKAFKLADQAYIYFSKNKYPKNLEKEKFKKICAYGECFLYYLKKS